MTVNACEPRFANLNHLFVPSGCDNISSALDIYFHKQFTNIDNRSKLTTFIQSIIVSIGNTSNDAIHFPRLGYIQIGKQMIQYDVTALKNYLSNPANILLPSLTNQANNWIQADTTAGFCTDVIQQINGSSIIYKKGQVKTDAIPIDVISNLKFKDERIDLSDLGNIAIFNTYSNLRNMFNCKTTVEFGGGKKTPVKFQKTDKIHIGRDGIKRVVYAKVGTNPDKIYVKRKSVKTGKFEYKLVSKRS